MSQIETLYPNIKITVKRKLILTESTQIYIHKKNGRDIVLFKKITWEKFHYFQYYSDRMDDFSFLIYFFNFLAKKTSV